MALYLCILAVSRDPAVRHFALARLATEREHLARLEALLPRGRRNMLLPIWRVGGWLTGALAALVGPPAGFATIDAVETFADHHYEAPYHRPGGGLRAMLIACQADEVEHRDQARAAGAATMGRLTRAWQWLVGTGSALAVMAAKRV